MKVSTDNPIQSPLDDLFAGLNRLNGLLHLLKSQLDNLRKLLNEIVDKGNLDLSSMLAGTSLAIRDLTEYPKNGWAVYYPSGKFVSQGEEYLQKIDVLVSRESAWTISQAYEAFETFLKDITAAFLHINSQYADTEKLTKSNSKLKKLSLEPTDIEYWKNFIRLNYRKNIDLLKFLREIAPELKEAEKQNNYAIDLTEWYTVVTEVRHAATHSNMLIKSRKMLSWSPGTHQLLTHFFPGKNTAGCYTLELSRKDAETSLRLFAEYAFAVFKCLSKLENYDWKVLKG